MHYWHAVFALLVAMAAAAVLTPVAARLARCIGALDKPRDRGLAIKETPTLGGLAIFGLVDDAHASAADLREDGIASREDICLRFHWDGRRRGRVH